MPGYTPYVAAQVTLTLANTNYDLWTLLTAIDASAPPTARELFVQSDSTNGPAKVFVGDVNMSATRFGTVLLSNDSQRKGGDIACNTPVAGTFLRTDTAGSKVNVEVIVT